MLHGDVVTALSQLAVYTRIRMGTSRDHRCRSTKSGGTCRDRTKPPLADGKSVGVSLRRFESCTCHCTCHRSSGVVSSHTSFLQTQEQTVAGHCFLLTFDLREASISPDRTLSPPVGIAGSGTRPEST